MTVLEVLLNAKANLNNWSRTQQPMFADIAKEQLDNAIAAMEDNGLDIDDEMPEGETE